jgi:hypothetical protein
MTTVTSGNPDQKSIWKDKPIEKSTPAVYEVFKMSSAR